MKIAITGASGGIARRLVAALRQSHEIVGIVRTPRPAEPGVRYVASADKAALAAALADVDCVIHAALDKKVKARDFLAVNRAMTEEVLKLSLAGRCRLFVYFSSQVVYSGSLPADPAAGYREDEPLALSALEDDYTRLKIEDERAVVSACGAAGVDWLVVRPTVVMGPGLPWSEDILRNSRLLTVGIGRRTINLVHVDDLARQLDRLIAVGAANEIFNLGTANVGTADYFGAVGQLNRRRPLLVPGGVLALAGRRLIPSTFWFFRTDVAIDCSKVARVTGFSSTRSVVDHFAAPPREIRAATLDAMRAVQASGKPFKVYGRGYSRWFGPTPSEDRLLIADYRGVVGIEGERVTVRAGTSFEELSLHLDKHGLALATLPEFSGISVGAAFFVDVHGTSREHFSVHDLIETVKYLDEAGAVVEMARNDPGWQALRARAGRVILIELTLRCEPAGWLSNDMRWEDDAGLGAYVEGGFRQNLATTIHWYPYRKRMLVYHINRSNGPEPGAARSLAPFRGMPYPLQRALIALQLRGRRRQIDRAHVILAPWRKVPAEWLWQRTLTKPDSPWRDVEICIRREDAIPLIEKLRGMIASGAFAFDRDRGIGLRFAHRREDGADFVWIEFVSGETAPAEVFMDAVHATCTNGTAYHAGKYVRPS